ncbi:MAG: MarR family transcriptional regulator [Rhodothermia bacterium]|nr:MAG: MarR family transcriptional regulator [Rhodothermia bacterium]
MTADRLSNETNAILKPFGISKEQYNVLRILRGQYPKPSTLSLIADRMISKTSNATRLVEKLRKKKLVERTQCEKNRRRVDILVTKQGIALLEELDPIVHASNRQMRNLTVKETKELNRLLDRMRG